MGACCGKGKPGEQKQQGKQAQAGAQAPVGRGQNPVQNAAAPVPAPSNVVASLFKHIPGTRKVLYFDSKDQTSSELTTSVPFKFHKHCGVSYSSKFSKIFLVGGFEGESLESPQSFDFYDDSMVFEISYLTGKRIQEYPSKVGFMTLLVHTRGDQEDLYSIGGCRLTQNEEGLEQGTFAVLRHRSEAWETLPMARDNCLCCPLSVLLNGIIYVAGGFLYKDKFENKDSVLVYRLQSQEWTNAQFKFAMIVGCLAVQYDQASFLIFGGSNGNEKNRKTYLLRETGIVNGEVQGFTTDKELWYPVLQVGNYFSVMSEDDFLVTYDKGKKTWTEVNMRGKMLEADKANLPGTVVPRSAKYYAFHVELGGNKITEYNTISGLTSESEYPGVTFHHDAGILIMPQTSEILLAGGIGGPNKQPVMRCVLVQPGTKKTRPMTDLPTPQTGLRMVSVAGQIYAMMGFNNDRSASQVYEETKKQWTSLRDPPQLVRYPACFAFKQTIYLVGGEKINESDAVSNSVQALNSVSKEWTALSFRYPSPVYQANAFVIEEKGVLIFGGDSGNEEPVKDCYLFNGKEFTASSKIDTDLELRFHDPPCHRRDEIYVYSKNADLFKLDVATLAWSEVDEDEESVGNGRI